MHALNVKGLSSAVIIALALALAIATIYTQPSGAAEPALEASAGPQTSLAPQQPKVVLPMSPARHYFSERLPVESGGHNQQRGFTFGSFLWSTEPILQGIKLIGWQEPGTTPKSVFDLSLELNGVGIQVEDGDAFGYLRADRAFLGGSSIGIRFRYRF